MRKTFTQKTTTFIETNEPIQLYYIILYEMRLTRF